MLGDGAGYPALERQRVAEISFVAFGPELLVSGHLDQLGGDPYSFTGTQHTSLDHGVDIQLAGNLSQGFANTLIGHRGRTGDHAYCADLPEVRDQLVGHSVGEIILRSIIGKVFQWQHCQGADRG